LFGVVRPYMRKGLLIQDIPIVYNEVTNELRFDHYEYLIEKGEYYTEDRMKVFFERSDSDLHTDKAIRETHRNLLIDMAEILRKHDANYRIIVNPVYDQKVINPKDKAALQQIFDEDRIYDFSGKNEYTADYCNYYEATHFRPHVTADILRYIYSEHR